jgi:hypothetical protein
MSPISAPRHDRRQTTYPNGYVSCRVATVASDRNKDVVIVANVASVDKPLCHRRFASTARFCRHCRSRFRLLGRKPQPSSFQRAVCMPVFDIGVRVARYPSPHPREIDQQLLQQVDASRMRRCTFRPNHRDIQQQKCPSLLAKPRRIGAAHALGRALQNEQTQAKKFTASAGRPA